VSVRDARFCHPTFRLNRRGNGSRLFVASGWSKVQKQSVGSGQWYLDRTRGSDMNRQGGFQSEWQQGEPTNSQIRGPGRWSIWPQARLIHREHSSRGARFARSALRHLTRCVVRDAPEPLMRSQRPDFFEQAGHIHRPIVCGPGISSRPTSLREVGRKPPRSDRSDAACPQLPRPHWKRERATRG
jgi:hypothetical protein